MRGEFERIEALRRQLERPDGEVLVGIGDDAAVLAPSGGSAVLTVDAAVEGVHFRRDLCSLSDAGYRAFTAAASDLAAMGARPRAALVALVLPSALEDEELSELVDGIAQAADAADAHVVGGNLSAGGELSITTTVVGDVTGPPLLRRGAKPGHALYVTGTIGGAALGLALLMAGRDDAEEAVRFCIQRWRRPRAALATGQRLRGRASACIDISDGLLQDLGHLCEASGVGARIHTDRLPLPEAFDALAASIDADPLALALGSGDDYELIFAAPTDVDAGPNATRIGEIVEGAGVRVLDELGHAIDLPARGFDHFGQASAKSRGA